MGELAGVVDERESRRRLQALVRELVGQGAIGSAAWRSVLERVPRHPFLPQFYLAGGSGDRTVGRHFQADAATESGSEWLDLVYRNETYVTALDPTTIKAVDGGWRGRPTSSCPRPSLIARMLEALTVRDGQRVLEIGTGSGYQAALLSERLGSRHVTTIDIDPVLAGAARQRLAGCGYTPTVAAGDGADGYAPGAPYDRVIATCAVLEIPPAWLAQTRPGGLIVANLRGELGGALMRLAVGEDGTASGRFLPGWGGFMPLRHEADRYPPSAPPELDPELDAAVPTVERATRVYPAALTDLAFGFVAQLHLPGVHLWQSWPDERGDWSLRLWGTDGSWAHLPHMLSPTRQWTVREHGRRMLWTLVEQAWQWWEATGHPRWDQFGMTVTPTGQRVWYASPDSHQCWPLPL